MSYLVYEKLCKLNNVNNAAVAKETGISPQTFSDWKKGKYTPKNDKLKKIADYFGVPLEYLTTGEMPDDTTTYYPDDVKEIADFMFKNPEYKVLFNAYKNVKPADIEFVKEMIERIGRE